MTKIMTIALAATFAVAAPAFAKKNHHRMSGTHAASARANGNTGATTGGSGGAVGQTGATQNGVNGQAGSGGASGGMGR